MSEIAAYKEIAKTQTNLDKLVKDHASLVKKIAYHLLSRLPQTVQLQDLFQSGMVGLIEAAEKYQEEKGTSFETFAGFRIRGAMLDFIRTGDWVPRSVYQNSRSISKAIQEVEKRTGREAQAREIAAELDVSLEKYHHMLGDSSFSELFSLDDMNVEALESFSNPDDPCYMLQKNNIKKLVADEIKQLPQREQLVLSLYNVEELSLKEIGVILDVSESRVSQIHSQAISRLRSRIQQKIGQD